MSKRNKHIRIYKSIALIIVSILFLLTLSLIWGTKHFGNISMEEIMFTLNMPLEGSGSDVIVSYFTHVVISSILFFIALAIILFKKNKYAYKLEINDKKVNVYPVYVRIPAFIMIVIIWFSSLAFVANKKFSVSEYIENQLHSSTFIEENYINPKDVSLKFPEHKRNLIYILLESGESSLQDKENGGLFEENYIPEMTQIAKENTSFSHSDKIEGAAVAPACGWTMAGMVAESAGIPLKLFKYDDKGVDNSMGSYESFLPGITNLGDILEDEGYRNYFLLGSDIRFAGRDKFMKQHGNYNIFDYYTAIERGKIDEDYYQWWGYEDQKLYEYAKEELTEISKDDTPFNYMMLTVDTHSPGGYVCPLCKTEHEEQYGNVWSCASKQLDDFIKWVQEQPFYEDTTIVVIGDHCSMDPDFFSDFKYDKHHGEVKRKVYNAIINPAIQPEKEEYRKFVTMDMFPTILASMGVKIEGERLGLGTNLFSSEETLSEKIGYRNLFDELNRKSVYYNEKFLYPEKD